MQYRSLGQFVIRIVLANYWQMVFSRRDVVAVSSRRSADVQCGKPCSSVGPEGARFEVHPKTFRAVMELPVLGLSKT